MGLIERWGTGTLKMIKQCREHGLPDPIFRKYSDGLLVQFTFEESIGPVRATTLKKEMTENLSDRQREIIAILEEHEHLKASDIMEKLGEPLSKRTLKDDLSVLKKLGLIDFRGRARATIWFLK